MAFFPIFVELKNVLVVGAGVVAFRKISVLLDYGANVTVVAPLISEPIQELAKNGTIRLIERDFADADTAGFDCAVAATANAECNRAVYESCKKRHILLNVADKPELCDFYFPALVRRGDLVVGIGTGGKSPAFSREVKKLIDATLPLDFDKKLETAALQRKAVLESGKKPSEDTTYNALVSLSESSKKIIKLGTRRSELALLQSSLVSKQLTSIFPNLNIEIVKKQTTGDKNLSSSLASFGGKGAFVSEFENMLLSKEIDIAVHSAKDLPVKIADGLCVAMTLPREDARDVIVWRKTASKNGTIHFGTSSPRREMQLKRLFPDCRVNILRGNVQTRLSRLLENEFDAIVLAAAGLKRLGLWNGTDKESADNAFVFQPLSFDEMLPAGGQGIIAVECRADDTQIIQMLKNACDVRSFAEFCVERYILFRLGCGCHEPTAVFSECKIDSAKITVAEEKNGSYQKKSVCKNVPNTDIDSLLSLGDSLLEKEYE